jgi:hypothetical protein
MHFQRAQTIQLVIKSTYAHSTKEARVCALVQNVGKEHMWLMRNYGHKKLHTPQNDTFMILVAPPPTSVSAPKSI